jgi:hypothetical protein
MSPRARRTLLAVTTVLATMVLAAGCNSNLAYDIVKQGKNLAESSDDAMRVAEQLHMSPQQVQLAGRELASGAPAGVVEAGREVDTSEGWKLLKVACQVKDIKEWLKADSDTKRRYIWQAQGDDGQAAIAKITLMADDLAEAKNAFEATSRVNAAVTCFLADQKAG